VSSVQRAQMVSLAAEAKTTEALSIRDTDFDVCQSLVKRAFSDNELKAELAKKCYSLTAANSINFARLMSQMVYHASAYLDAVALGLNTPGQPINAVIPSGNFGNAMAAVYAREMGFPIGLVMCASNANNILADFLPDPIPADETVPGDYDISGRSLRRTSSPAIDILRASNIERLVHLLAARRATSDDAAAEAAAVTKAAFAGLDTDNKYSLDKALVEEMGMEGGLMLAGGWATEGEVAKTVAEVTAEAGVPIDTHTAVAMAVLRRVLRSDHDTAPARALRANPTYVTLTAHFSKFPTDFARSVLPKADGEVDSSEVDLEDARNTFMVACDPSHPHAADPHSSLVAFGEAVAAKAGDAATAPYWELHRGVGPLAHVSKEVYDSAPSVVCEYDAVRDRILELASACAKR